jgi:hypothetical protein
VLAVLPGLENLEITLKDERDVALVLSSLPKLVTLNGEGTFTLSWILANYSYQ